MVFEDFDEATEAKTDGQTVCGTLLTDGTARYFLMPGGSNDEEIRERSFEIREGRPMSGYERWALGVAETNRHIWDGQPA